MALYGIFYALTSVTLATLAFGYPLRGQCRLINCSALELGGPTVVQSHWALLGFKISYFSTTATSSYWWTVLSCSFCFLTFVLPQHGHVLSDIPDIPCQIMSIYGHVSWCFMIFHQSPGGGGEAWRLQLVEGRDVRCVWNSNGTATKSCSVEHLKATQIQTRLGGWCHGDVMIWSLYISLYCPYYSVWFSLLFFLFFLRSVRC